MYVCAYLNIYSFKNKIKLPLCLKMVYIADTAVSIQLVYT